MLYKIDQPTTSIEKIKGTTLAKLELKEKDLENIIVENIESLVRTDQLLVIMQERSYKEEADILAVDECGSIYIFELKRWKSKQENILQVLRYGQKFGRYDYEKLNYYFQRYSKKKEQTLQHAHKEYFGLEEPVKKDNFNRKQRFIIVTNGIDYETWDAIAYWRNMGIDISAQVYWIYKINNEAYIDFNPYGPIPDAPKEDEEGIFIVNTNKTYDPDAYKDMVINKKASAYDIRKSLIKKIKAGNTVCLYHVGVGIIGIGKAKTDFQKNKNEYFVPIDFDYLVDIKQGNWRKQAVTAASINNEFKTSHRFRQTVFTLPKKYERFIKNSLSKKIVKSKE